MEGRTKRKAAELATAKIEVNVAKKARIENQTAQSKRTAAESLLQLSSNPVEFLDVDGVEGDAAKYVKYLKEKLTTKSPAVVVATKAFGPKVVADFIANRKAVRYMFAPADNTAQCMRSGLQSPNEKTLCWLCGYGLYRDRKAVDTIACEHILPVIQAVMFADIALPKTPSTSTPELVQAEYAWAHAVCNGPKSSSVFIKEVHDDKGRVVKWAMDDSEVMRVLQETVSNIRRANIDNGQLRDPKEVEAWLKQRLVFITGKLQPILDKINYGEDTVRMNILFGVAKLIDPERWASKTQLDQQAYAQYADQVIERASETSLQQMGNGRRSSRKRQTKRKHRKTLKYRR